MSFNTVYTHFRVTKGKKCNGTVQYKPVSDVSRQVTRCTILKIIKINRNLRTIALRNHTRGSIHYGFIKCPDYINYPSTTTDSVPTCIIVMIISITKLCMIFVNTYSYS